MRYRLCTFLFITAMVPPSVLAIAIVFGSSGGRGQFSPDSLEYRSQSEVLLWGTKQSVYQSRWRYHNHTLIQFLVNNGYWHYSDIAENRWIFLFHSNSQWRDGESSFHRAFFWKDDFWIEWTNKQPEQAAVLWPRVLESLRLGDEQKAVEMLHEVLHSP